MAPSSATQFRATPATVQSVTGRSRETFKLTPQQPLTANRSGGFSSRETHRTQRGRSVQPRVFVGSRPTPTRRAWPKKRRCPQAGIHPKPSQPPHAHHPWFLHRGSSTNIGIGPRPPFQRPDAGRHRAKQTKRELTWTAGLQLEHS